MQVQMQMKILLYASIVTDVSIWTEVLINTLDHAN